MGTPELQFESAVMEHLDAAHNLARWLMKNEQDAQDVVQESCLKAFRAFGSFRGGDFRAWLLMIVRNTCFTWLQRNRGVHCQAREQSLDVGESIAADEHKFDPEILATRSADAELVRSAIEQLPVLLREAVILREMEDLSYKEIAKIAEVPIGTIMSRLARGRAQLQKLLCNAEVGRGA